MGRDWKNFEACDRKSLGCFEQTEMVKIMVRTQKKVKSQKTFITWGKTQSVPNKHTVERTMDIKDTPCEKSERFEELVSNWERGDSHDKVPELCPHNCVESRAS